MYLPIILTFLLFFGLIVGSFLNVVIYRLENKKRKNLGGRSFCPNCEKQIDWHDNIPVFSWLLLKGKCRHCKRKISVQYPLVELSTGALFSQVGVSLIGQTDVVNALSIINLIFLLAFTASLVIIYVYDLKHQIIPDEVIYPMLVLALLFVAINALSIGTFDFALDHVLTGLLAGAFFYTLALVSNGKWMGGGDIKLVTFMGLLLGWQGMLVALYVAFILGALVGGFAILTKEKKLGSKIPFGPFLVIGTFVGLFLGEKIISFYVNMFL